MGGTGRWWCWLVWTCWVFGMLQAETIHFTNSPKLIMASKNFTTYEIEVPGSKPITIIEATDAAHQTRPSGVPATTSFRTSTGLTVARPMEQDTSEAPRKTLYSPDLLNKFLKEYSEKLRNADSATRKRLNEISQLNSGSNRLRNESTTGVSEIQYRNKRPNLDDNQGESQSASDSESPEDDEPKGGDEFVFNDTHERHVLGAGVASGSNKRWYQEPSGGYQQLQHQGRPHLQHPWNVKDGWVTLEAVPWSESKVSKWHASGSGSEPAKPGKSPSQDKHWYGGASIVSEETPKYRPIATSGSIGASSYSDSVDNADDAYGYGAGTDNRLPSNRLPSYAGSTDSLYNRRRPTVSLYAERPDADRSRPTPTPPVSPLDSWYDQQQQQQPQQNPYDAMKAYGEGPQGNGPANVNRDIITDGRPANFPAYPHPDRAVQSVQSTPNRPGTYPDRGNGEWVLISTTKGYQYPKRRHGQRAITFTPASATSHQTVRLTVLPMKNAVDMTTSHNGLIEVSSSTQTVEDAVKQQKGKRKGQRVPAQTTTSGPPATGHRKKKPLAPSTQTFSLMRRDTAAAQDSSAVLAAVGAGMVPATMAIIAPMVLGRKRK
ncbi:uncharacterized protein LOC128721244 [Anopheles nili]|uniref:uncharacterized protein LOC128721244 n=1 Tax=Anopheles nili TaxID=185578 RepID=UPI00237C1D62|nr:uncharacterized protein LOC128721244 [Anopheles nili]